MAIRPSGPNRNAPPTYPKPEAPPSPPPLINREKMQRIDQPKPQELDLTALDVAALLKLRETIDQLLPALSLADLNMEKELVIQYLAIKAMLAKIADDPLTPANQRAQVANSVTSILGDMTKMQNSLYSSERVKKLEAAMIKALESAPVEARQVFLDRYEEIYNNA